MHTESSLALLESLTTEFGLLMQSFQELTCADFVTVELPREVSARNRKEVKATAAQSKTSHAIVAAHPAVESTEVMIADPAPPTDSVRKN